MWCPIALVSWLLPASVLAASNSRIFPRQSNNGTDYVLKQGPLDTPWTEKVGTNPWPEYPRPQLQRSEWKNLNGVWRYQNTTANAVNSPPFGVPLPNPVLVPFCLESALSGMLNFAVHVWVFAYECRCYGAVHYLELVSDYF